MLNRFLHHILQAVGKAVDAGEGAALLAPLLALWRAQACR